MTDMVTLPAAPRTGTGKGPNRRLRATGMVPAVVYGGKDTPELCAVLMKELTKQLRTNANFFSQVIALDFGDRKLEVVPREAQLDPVVDETLPLHVDFLRATAGGTVTVQIPVVFRNDEKSPGLKRGGVLNIVRREIELICPIGAIPESIEVDLEGCEIGDSIHVSAVTLPAEAQLTITDRDFTIATITGKGGKDEGAAETDEEEEETTEE